MPGKTFLIMSMLAAGSLVLTHTGDTLAAFVDKKQPPALTISGEWNLTKLNHSALNIAGYTLAFSALYTCSARMHCNTCSYQFAATSQTVSFTRTMCTLVACQGKSREDEFFTAMGKVTHWGIDGTDLYCMNAKNDTIMEYSSAEAQLPGRAWELESINRLAGRSAIAQPANYTALFAVDGTLRLKSDCNLCSGTYQERAAGRTLSIDVGRCTKMLCESGSHGGTYNSILEKVQTYAIKGDLLYCYFTADTLVFREKATALREGHGTTKTLVVPTVKISHNQAGYLAVRVQTGVLDRVSIITMDGTGALTTVQPFRSDLSIDVRGLAKGVYLVKASTSTGGLFTGRVIITR